MMNGMRFLADAALPPETGEALDWLLPALLGVLIVAAVVAAVVLIFRAKDAPPADKTPPEPPEA